MHPTPHQMLLPISWRRSEYGLTSCQVNQLLDAPFFSLMADEGTDIANVEEISLLFCRWVENRSPVEISWNSPFEERHRRIIYSTLQL